MRSGLVAFTLGAAACKFSDVPPLEIDAAPIDAPTVCLADTAVCAGEVSRVCDSSGDPLPDEMCWLGCNAATGRCERLASSNGLDTYLDRARLEPAIDLRPAAVVDVANGVITVAGVPISVGTDLVPATSGGAPVRVFYASSFAIGDVTVTGVPEFGGGNAMAILSSGSIVLAGVLDVSANGHVSGPGVPSGGSGQSSASTGDLRGAGGGGFGSDGGNGGLSTVSGQDSMALRGAVAVGTSELEPLRGGGAGGLLQDVAGFGGGGGVVQLSSETSIAVLPTGGIDAGGAGGISGGGGSGGGVLLEAPTVQVDGAFIAANGGGGGSRCSSGGSGADGPRNASRAAGHPGCMDRGPGGAGAANPISAAGNGGPDDVGGSGGGGAGRIMIRTRTGAFSPVNGSVVSPPPQLATTRAR